MSWHSNIRIINCNLRKELLIYECICCQWFTNYQIDNLNVLENEFFRRNFTTVLVFIKNIQIFSKSKSLEKISKLKSQSITLH